MPYGNLDPATSAGHTLINILGFNTAQLKELFETIGEKSFRAKQLCQAIHQQGLKDLGSLTTFSKDLREKLSQQLTLARPEIATSQLSTDGTRKWLLTLADKNQVEMVYIPEKNRGTLCISSQIGCTLTCTFCHTGTQRLVRNLEPHEIMGQILLARDELNDWGKENQAREITNIVLMGMGEPLYNYDNVKTAMKLLMDPDGAGWSKRRITLSTSGVVPKIKECGDELNVNLAISLHGTTNEIRSKLVPLNKKYPIEELIQACREYPGMGNPETGHGRRVTFEYVMLDGVNDAEEDAHRLIELIKGIPSKINLIPFNPWPNSLYVRSSDEAIAKFAKIVEAAGYQSPVRRPRGEDIMAACGQLKSESVKERRSVTASKEK